MVVRCSLMDFAKSQFLVTKFVSSIIHKYCIVSLMTIKNRITNRMNVIAKMMNAIVKMINEFAKTVNVIVKLMNAIFCKNCEWTPR